MSWIQPSITIVTSAHSPSHGLLLCFSLQLKMAENEVSLQENTVSDYQLMEEIRKYAPIYDKKCKGFQDRRVKANCWKKIAEILGMTVEEAERRYKTMRTAFSRYLSRISGKSGSGINEVGPVDPKYEHMRWLMPFIKSRQSFSNLNLPTRSKEECEETMEREMLEDSGLSFAPEEQTQTNINEDSNDTFNEVERPQTQTEEQSGIPDEGRPTTAAKEGIHDQSKKKRKMDPNKNWIGSNISAKAQLEKTDCEIKQTIISLDKTLELINSQSNNAQGMDEDSYYCMSLASRLRRLDPRKKAIARNGIEKVLFNIEFRFQNMHSSAVLDHGFPHNSNMQSTPSSYGRESNHIFVDAASNNSYQEL